MSQEAPTIRRARPEDSLAAADLIITTGENIFGYLFFRDRARTLDLVRHLFEMEGNELSHTHAYLAEIDGRISGIISFLTRREMRKTNRAMAGAIVAQMGLLSALMRLPRYIHFDQLTEAVDGSGYYIEHLATTKAFRRRGVATHLLSFCEAHARERGLGRLALDVDVDNAPAMRLYERFGFRPARRTMTRVLGKRIGFRGFCRMVKDLPERRLYAASAAPESHPHIAAHPGRPRRPCAGPTRAPPWPRADRPR